ncbi:MAG: DUF5518 domain-containing protein [Methanobacterium sp.]
MINWKAITIGFILTVIFALILNSFIGEIGSYISILIAGIIVGYLIKGNWINGAFHGAMIGILGGIIAVIILLIVGGFVVIMDDTFSILIRIVLDVILGAIGGAAGTIIRRNNY